MSRGATLYWMTSMLDRAPWSEFSELMTHSSFSIIVRTAPVERGYLISAHAGKWRGDDFESMFGSINETHGINLLGAIMSIAERMAAQIDRQVEARPLGAVFLADLDPAMAGAA